MENVPEHECPKCGAVYAKVEATIAKKNQESAKARESRERSKAVKHLSPSERMSRRYASIAVGLVLVAGLGFLWMVIQSKRLHTLSDPGSSSSDRQAMEVASEEAQIVRAEAGLDHVKCRQAAANKWLVDFTMAHGVTSEA